MLDHRVEPHDANQLELKLAYVVEPGRRRVRYQVETFLFVPKTLGIDRHSYDADRFFADTAAFLRLRTPSIALASLASANRANVWFRDLERDLARPLGQGDGRRLVRRIKILGCIYRQALGDDARPLVEQLAGAPAPDPLAEGRLQETCARHLQQFARNLERALARLRALDEECLARGYGDLVCDTWRAVDEYTAMIAEDACTDLVEAIARRTRRSPLEHPDLTDARDVLARAAFDAQRYRRERGYRSQLFAGESNEALPHWRRTIKRIVYSALYLDVRHEEGDRLVRDIVGMAAAAIAMAFAIAVTIFAQITWDLLSGSFVAIMIVMYMIKDRLKEWGKRYLGGRVARMTPDRVVVVRDAGGEAPIGVCRESFVILPPRSLEPAIEAARHSRRLSEIERSGRPEAVIRYTKDVTLDSAALKEELAGLEGLQDVIRFNLGHLRDRMDTPREDHRLVDPQTGRVEVIPCARVYHLNLVLRLTVGSGATRRQTIERVRLVLDQNGIKRVEFLDANGRVSTTTPA